MSLRWNADALHLLGVIALARDDLRAAVELIEQAISIRREAEFYVNPGLALRTFIVSTMQGLRS